MQRMYPNQVLSITLLHPPPFLKQFQQDSLFHLCMKTFVVTLFLNVYLFSPLVLGLELTLPDLL
jgi:hypothetical protein